MHIPLRINDTLTAVVFSTAHARRKAQIFAQPKQDTISYAYVSGTSAYLVEQGNQAKFSLPMPTFSLDLQDYKAFALEVSLGDTRGTSPIASLYCFFCDDYGYQLEKKRITIQPGTNMEVFQCPKEATRVSFAIRLEGQGVLSDLSLAADLLKNTDYELPKKKSAPKAAASATTSASATAASQAPLAPKKPKGPSVPLEPFQALLKARDFGRCIEAINELPDPQDRELRLLVQAYDLGHNFEEVVETYWRMTDKGRLVPGVRQYYLRALANLGKMDEAKAFVQSCLMDLDPTSRNVEFLPLAYPFALSMDDTLAAELLERIISSVDLMEKVKLNPLLRCTHDLIAPTMPEAFYRMCNAIYHKAKTPEDKAKFDILTSQYAFTQGRFDTQMHALNKAICAFGALPIINTKPDKAPDFWSFACPDAAPRSIKDGPLVSIIMTCYNSAETIEYAVASVLNQTYDNIELITVNDCSPDGTIKKLRKLARKDKRIVVVDQKQNGGAYVARNSGIKRAKGVYVTCQDHDDWAHPQKIERMVRNLQENQSILATAVQHVRYDPERGYRGRNGYIGFDASSIMFPREQVLGRIGYYDTIRAGGDGEYQFRMERAFGRGCLQPVSDLLSLVFWSERTLSGGGTFGISDDTGVFSPARNAYRRSFCKWQETTDHLYMDFPPEKRVFELEEID